MSEGPSSPFMSPGVFVKHTTNEHFYPCDVEEFFGLHVFSEENEKVIILKYDITTKHWKYSDDQAALYRPAKAFLVARENFLT